MYKLKKTPLCKRQTNQFILLRTNIQYKNKTCRDGILYAGKVSNNNEVEWNWK